MIDVTMTATLRPKVIEATLCSFIKGILFPVEEFRLIINVDPVGEENVKQEAVVDLCKQYIPTVLARYPKQPSFADAVVWCWHMVETNYVFHLEDDWLMRKPVQMSELVDILERNPEISSVRLCKYKLPKGVTFSLNKHVMYDYTGNGYYVCRLCDQFSLNPTLIRRVFMREALPFMTTDQNPEKQFRIRNPKMKEVMERWKTALYGKPGEQALVSDNGLGWRSKHGFKKGGGKPEDFVTWAKLTTPPIRGIKDT